MEFENIDSISQLNFAIPDIFIALSFAAFIIIKFIIGERRSLFIFPKLSVVLTSVCFIVTLAYGSIFPGFFNSLFVYNYSLSCFKSILLFCTVVIFLMVNASRTYGSANSSAYFLIFGIISAIMICISANNFISLILGLEIYSFSICFLLSANSKEKENKENAIRFLLISSFMTAVLYFGSSLYYGQFGSLTFTKILLNDNFLSLIGTILVASGLLFKLGVSPFHSWTVDIYQKTPTAIILFFDTAWKFFMTLIFIRFFKIILIGDNIENYRIYFTLLSLLSLIIGSIAPLFQKNIKKFIAYTSVGHIGFVLTIFAAAKNIENLSLALSYIASYSIASLIFFITILIIKKHKKVETFDDLFGLAYDSPILGYSILISMFGMVATPPLVSFIAKLEIFKFLIEGKSYLLLISSIIYSIFSLLYASKYSKCIFRHANKKREIHLSMSTNIFLIFTCVISFISIFFYNSINNWFAELLSSI